MNCYGKKEMANLSNLIIAIPCYNPSALFLNTIEDLCSYEKIRKISIIVLNDGSTVGLNYFRKVESYENIIILNHLVNMGKGAALKTIFHFVLKEFNGTSDIITVDADFQHKGIDVLNLLESRSQNLNSLFAIGVRSFSFSKVPFRSFMGNVISQSILYLLYGVRLKDTQSGLRIYSKKVIEGIININANGYDFEMEVILFLIRNNIVISEVSISLNYIENNKSSHFRPIVDSYKIISKLVKRKFIS